MLNKIENQFIAKAKNDIQTLQNLEKKVLQNQSLIKTLYIIYRDLKEYEKMINLYEKILLEKIIDKFGEDSERLGILGRVYKDLWQETNNNQYLKKAMDIYKKGFEENLNDYYPGINLITLALYDDNKEIIQKYLPIVEVAIQKAIEKQKDYWNLATMFELSFIKKDCALAKKILDEIIVVDKEKWMMESALNNLNFLMKKMDDECLESVKEKFKESILDLI